MHMNDRDAAYDPSYIMPFLLKAHRWLPIVLRINSVPLSWPTRPADHPRPLFVPPTPSLLTVLRPPWPACSCLHFWGPSGCMADSLLPSQLPQCSCPPSSQWPPFCVSGLHLSGEAFPGHLIWSSFLPAFFFYSYYLLFFSSSQSCLFYCISLRDQDLVNSCQPWEGIYLPRRSPHGWLGLSCTLHFREHPQIELPASCPAFLSPEQTLKSNWYLLFTNGLRPASSNQSCAAGSSFTSILTNQSSFIMTNQNVES